MYDKGGKSSIFDCFEDEEAVLSDVEVNVVIGFVRDEWAEVPPHKRVPISVVLSVEFVFEVRRDLLDGVHFVERVLGDGQDLGLHFRADVLHLYHGLLLPRLGH